jgi:hypothetical protein
MAKQKQQETERQDEAPAEKISRYDAAHRVVAAIDGETSLKQLVDTAEALVVDSGGGKYNRDATEEMIWNVLYTAEALGVIEIEYRIRRKAAK